VDELLPLVAHWIPDPTDAAIDPVVNGGFSGARIWKVNFRGQVFALRQWPSAVSSERLFGMHQFQRWLSRNGSPVPWPVGASSTGQTFIHERGVLWELATWMPGAADYHALPQPEKLAAALRSLAELHLAAAQMPVQVPSWVESVRPSPALIRRSEKLCNLVLGKSRNLQNAVNRLPPSKPQQTAHEALALVQRTAEAELQKSQRWETEPLSMHLCLRDVWHDHILYTDSHVTGIIDFGAMGFDSPAGDVARLLGSMVGDDSAGWRLGLEAYEAVKPLQQNERDAIAFFDSSGVVLSAVNWVHWLFRDSSTLPTTIDRGAALDRLERLVARLRVLAAAPGA
jgi:Ser/Thr protein kinase RdoA (MazF antagonist)